MVHMSSDMAAISALLAVSPRCTLYMTGARICVNLCVQYRNPS